MGQGEPRLEVPLSRLAVTAGALEEAAAELDRVGGDGPPGGAPGDTLGDAEVVVAAALAVALQGAARIAAEAHALGAAVRLCHEDMARTDAVAVVDLFRVDP